MIHVRILTRADCHLCDVAKDVITAAAREFDLDIREVDIATDTNLEAEYGWHIPVIFINGKERFRHRVQPESLRQVLSAIASPR